MNYIQCINDSLNKASDTENKFVVYGQNVVAGSCIGGLGRGIGDTANRTVINTPNVENTQVGVGFGLMLQGISSVYVMKQLDFLLLGIDQLTNTNNRS